MGGIRRKKERKKRKRGRKKTEWKRKKKRWKWAESRHRCRGQWMILGSILRQRISPPHSHPFCMNRFHERYSLNTNLSFITHVAFSLVTASSSLLHFVTIIVMNHFFKWVFSSMHWVHIRFFDQYYNSNNVCDLYVDNYHLCYILWPLLLLFIKHFFVINTITINTMVKILLIIDLICTCYYFLMNSASSC